MPNPRKPSSTPFDKALAKPGDSATHPITGSRELLIVWRLDDDKNGVAQYRIGNDLIRIYTRKELSLGTRLFREINPEPGNRDVFKSTLWKPQI